MGSIAVHKDRRRIPKPVLFQDGLYDYDIVFGYDHEQGNASLKPGADRRMADSLINV